MHLPSLNIEGFRGICSLNLKDFRRITLLAGKNGTGKTTILDAIRIYASRGDIHTISKILEHKEEYVTGINKDGSTIQIPDYFSLFHNNVLSDEFNFMQTIQINSGQDQHSITLHQDNSNTESQGKTTDDSITPGLKLTIGNTTMSYSHGQSASKAQFDNMTIKNRQKKIKYGKVWPNAIEFESLGPDQLDSYKIARLWSTIVLTESEEYVNETLRLILGDDLLRIALLYDPPSNRPEPRFVVRLKSSPEPVPLKRLGAGALRLFGIAIALANCRNGILLIDEFENGIRYSIQEKLWRMIFHAAEKDNIQVFATTHSQDCIHSFAKMAKGIPDAGTLMRLERYNSELHVVHYPHDDLIVAGEQGIEVR